VGFHASELSHNIDQFLDVYRFGQVHLESSRLRPAQIRRLGERRYRGGGNMQNFPVRFTPQTFVRANPPEQ
jgi:hypothetical protein